MNYPIKATPPGGNLTFLKLRQSSLETLAFAFAYTFKH